MSVNIMAANLRCTEDKLNREFLGSIINQLWEARKGALVEQSELIQSRYFRISKDKYGIYLNGGSFPGLSTKTMMSFCRDILTKHVLSLFRIYDAEEISVRVFQDHEIVLCVVGLRMALCPD